MIEEIGVFWYPPNIEGSIEEVFYGLEESSLQPILLEYDRYVRSIMCRESMLSCCGKDLDLYSIEEGKSVSGWSGSFDRRSLGKRIKNNSRYKNLLKKGKNVGSSQFSRLNSKFEKDLKRLLADYQNDKIDMKRFRRESSELFRKAYEDAWFYGRKSSGIYNVLKNPSKPKKEEERWFRGAVREELAFWNSFLDELEKDKDLSGKKFSVQERVEMYAETIRFMFNAGQLSGMPDTVLLHWYPKNKPNMCPGCQYMVDNSPFTRETMPTTPKAGDTPCLYRCAHRVVVRHSTPTQVAKRIKQLPSKDKMLRDLRNIMGGKAKKNRKRSRDYNPWLGQSVWGLLK